MRLHQEKAERLFLFKQNEEGRQTRPIKGQGSNNEPSSEDTMAEIGKKVKR